ncbi:MAG TPA: ribosome-associated translation inhibitor RaiA [Ktedonobacteraceae bacterium]|nr:ribosome-associated translation inhibitor RaiA [Ktedonobacteraceae bacterium]
MNIIIKGKQMEVTPRLRQYIERKVQRLSRLVDAETRVEVTVTEEQTRSAHDRYCVQLALAGSVGGFHPIRSEVSGLNANKALDVALDKVLAQLGRQKDRHTTTLRHHTLPVKILALTRSGDIIPLEKENEAYDGVGGQKRQDGLGEQDGEDASYTNIPVEQEQNEEIWLRVLEIRRVPTKPMDDQEVIAQMETLGVSFLPFFNEATNSVNVMYKLGQGGYGLLVPELV